MIINLYTAIAVSFASHINLQSQFRKDETDAHKQLAYVGGTGPINWQLDLGFKGQIYG